MAVVIVPARLASTRFPEKVLRAETGKPLVQHVVESARRAACAERVVVAADHRTIAEALRPFGTDVVLTKADHPNGSARLAEAAELLGLADDTVVVNVQGDEPEIEAHVVDAAHAALVDAGPEVGMSTVGSPFAAGEDPGDPNIVKLVRSAVTGRALYFSRSPAPHDRDAARRGGPPPAPPLKHVGLYCYRVWMLKRYVQLTPTPLEETEKLEQLRVLEHGLPIAAAVATAAHHGIDTAEQYAAFVERFRASGDGAG